MKTIKAVLPVAGEGTRLRPHTLTKPKVLLRIAGKPMLSYILDEMIPYHIDEQIFIVGHLGDMIEEFVTTTYPRVNSHFIEQKDRLGLGHAVYLSREFLDPEDDMLIILGDTIFELDLETLIQGDRSLIGVKEVQDPRRFGVVQMEGDAVTQFVEKPSTFVSNKAIVGMYYIKRAQNLIDALAHNIEHGVTTKGEYQLTDALQRMVEKGHDFGVIPVEGWFDCGKPETLLETNQHFLKKAIALTKSTGGGIIPPCYIGKDVKLDNSTIGPYVSIEDGCSIKDSTISNSIIYNDSTVNDCIIKDSIIGSNTTIEGGSLIINIGDHASITSQK